MSKTIEDVQNEYARALSWLAPVGFAPVVALLDRDGRKKRKNASAANWDPLTGSMSVTFAKKEEPAYADQEVLKEAIDRGLFLINKVPDPKAPAFPTTAIRLNRHKPEVQRILGTSPIAPSRSFRPVEIAGEPLSATVTRERG